MTDSTPSSTQPDIRSRSNGIFWGVVLILLGALFFLRETLNLDLRNWWALFIFLPAFGSFSSAIFMIQRAGRLNEGARSSIGSGLIIGTVATIFLFNLDWGVYWPLMVIVPGLVVLGDGFTLPGSREAERPLALRLYRPWLGWTGLAAALLGAGFLTRNLGIFDPAQIHPRWWALSILIPALGGVITALRLAISGSGFWAQISNLIAVAVFAVVGAIAIIGLDWNLILPIIVIAVGVILLIGVFRK